MSADNSNIGCVLGRIFLEHLLQHFIERDIVQHSAHIRKDPCSVDFVQVLIDRDGMQ